MNKQAKPAGRGRPQGAANIQAKAEVSPSVCPGCGSSLRTRYERSTKRDYLEAGVDYDDGVGHVIGFWDRVCRCAECGLPRHDREKIYQGSDLPK